MSNFKKKFSFKSSALPGDTFEVVSFTGSESLSRLYRFDVTLVSENAELDLEKVIHSRATLTILREKGNIRFNGILSAFQQMQAVNNQVYYRATLTPALWRHTLTFHNQIFLDKTAPEIIEATLKDCGLTSLDFEFRLASTYTFPKRDYVCQYGESHFSFISRWMEREGIYFYFEQNDDRERLIVTNTAMIHGVMTEGEKMNYSPVSGLDEESREEVIKSFICTQNILPAKVTLKDYNYMKPSLELSAEAIVSENGIGDVYIYGENFALPEEGNHLAGIRADELKCRGKVFHGESLIPFLRPGYKFKLERHYRKDFNTTFLTTEIQHSGKQEFYLTSGLTKETSERESSPYYSNTFKAILTTTQFRPERITDKPRFSGTISANIDAEGSSQYAEIDEYGRYKVRMPFDLSDAKGGKGSYWLRMAQPYAGKEHGMHFPLHKETEVLLTFIDGDPDRPIISAAIPNLLTASPVTSANSTQNRINTAGGNKIHFEDQQGGQRIQFETPHANTWLRMGAPNDPPGDDDDHKTKKELEYEKKDGFKVHTDGDIEYEAINERKFLVGAVTDIVAGIETSIVGGMRNHITLIDLNEVTIGIKMALQLAAGFEYAPEKCMWTTSKHEMHAFEHEIHEEITKFSPNDLHVIATIRNKIAGVSNRVKTAETNIKTLKNDVKTNKTSINGVKNKLLTQNNALTAQITELGTHTTELGTQKTELLTQKTALSTQKQVIAEQKTELTGQITNLSNTVTDIQTTNTTFAATHNIL